LSGSPWEHPYGNQGSICPADSDSPNTCQSDCRTHVAPEENGTYHPPVFEPSVRHKTTICCRLQVYPEHLPTSMALSLILYFTFSDARPHSRVNRVRGYLSGAEYGTCGRVARVTRSRESIFASRHNAMRYIPHRAQERKSRPNPNPIAANLTICYRIL